MLGRFALIAALVFASQANAVVHFGGFAGRSHKHGFTIERNGNTYHCRTVERIDDKEVWSCTNRDYHFDKESGKYKPKPVMRCHTVRRAYIAKIYCSDGSNIDITKEPNYSGERR